MQEEGFEPSKARSPSCVSSFPFRVLIALQPKHKTQDTERNLLSQQISQIAIEKGKTNAVDLESVTFNRFATPAKEIQYSTEEEPQYRSGEI